jgi:hypothetical protein
VKRSSRLVLWLFGLVWVLTGQAAVDLEVNAQLPSGEQYRRLSLILLIGEGVQNPLVEALQARVGGAPARAVDPEELVTPLIRIVDQQTMLTGAVYLFRLAREHGAEIGRRLEQLESEHPGLADGAAMDVVREDAILVRNAIADSMEYAAVESAGPVAAYRQRTLELRNLLEFNQFSRELHRITREAIESVGGKADAYQRMFDDETGDDAFDRQIRAAEYPYRGRAAFDEDAGKVAEQVIEGVVLSESQPGQP